MARATVVGALCLLVGLIVGAAVGVTLTSGQSESDVARTAMPPVSQTGTATERMPTPEPQKRARAGDAPIGGATDAESRSLIAKVMTTDSDSAPKGDGVIRGTVITSDGVPQRGIVFVLTAEFPSGSAGRRTPSWTPADLVAPQPPLADRLAQHLARERWSDSTRQMATSGTDGRFEFRGLAAVQHQVQPASAGWQVLPKNPQKAWRCLPGAELEFTATRLGQIRASVLLADGTAPASATVWLAQGQNNQGQEWSDANPVLSFTPGRYRAWADCGRFKEWKSDSVDIEVPADGDPVALTLQLRSSSGFGGNLRIDPAWGAQQYVQLRAQRMDADVVPPVDSFSSSEHSAHASAWDDFSYSFTGLTTGRYAVAVSVSGNDVVAMWTVDVGASFVARDFELGPPERSKFVELMVLDPEGTPIRDGLSVSSQVKSARRSRSSGASPVARPDGTRWILMPTEGVDADSVTSLQVTHAEYGTQEVIYRIGPNAAAEVKFEWPAFADVVMEGWNAHPQRDAFVVGIRPLAGDPRRNNMWGQGGGQPGPDQSGHQRLGPVTPGEYEVVLWLKSAGGRSYGIQTERVNLPAGANSVSVRLPALHTLVVELGVARAGKTIRCNFGTGEQGDSLGDYTADAAGKVTMARLPPGVYTLRLDGERTARSVTVPDTLTLTW